MNEQRGYYRFPTIHGDEVVFVSEDDLWLAPATGGVARRLTANLGAVSHPCFSADGKWLAFVGREEGHAEVYLVSASGGPAKRLTYLGSNTAVVGWHDGRIVFASSVGQPFAYNLWLHTVDTAGRELERIELGPARSASWGPKGMVIGRNTGDPARWKRYRGGTAGELWIDAAGSGTFEKLVDLAGNLACPMWIGERIYFVSDHEGVGNIYSCLPSGEDLRQHTEHSEFYARNASTDGTRIVCHAGADIHVLDPQTGENWQVEIAYHSPRIQRSRKFVEADKYLEDYAPSPDGSMLALVHRGKTFTLGNWEGPVLQHGARNGVRYHLTRWLRDGKRVVTVSDESGEDQLEIHATDGLTPPVKLPTLDLGRPQRLKVSPRKDEIALTNHRQELILIDLEEGTAKTIDQSKHNPIFDYDWSPDGRWIAYSIFLNRRVAAIRLYDTQSGETHQVTQPLLIDYAPTFDPTGKYLYFLSARILNPVYDGLHFDLGFPKGVRPYAITLRKDVPSPFVPQPRPFEPKKEDDEKSPEGKEPGKEGGEKPEETLKVEVDLDGIQERVVPVPVEEAIYTGIAAIEDKIFYTVYPVEGALGASFFETAPPAKQVLKVYDLQKLEEAVFVGGISGFALSADGTTIACRLGNRLRVTEAKRDPSQELPKEDAPGRKNGWIDLARVKVSIEPVSEWLQMLREAWRLQRDHFWVEDMAGVDWERVLRRYEPLVERVASRSEFSDLVWEVQGELGTSHCYELGGDYRPEPAYKLGFLGADLAYEPEHDAYRLVHIATGDVWDDKHASPLKRPGVNVEKNMLLLAVGGERVGRERSPGEILVNLAGQELQLTVADADGTSPRTVTVKTVPDETPIRYRDWVEGNRQYVHEKSGGKVGYIHIPDMSARGYAEFHRHFLVELDHKGLVVDVRYNGGGHVSGLLLGKLARERVGYVLTRWMGDRPYPGESVAGPIAILTNEQAGSDGDIFCHAAKLIKLGKLIGRRTWGGVIGIWPRNVLVDGTVTTQPEHAFWFKDVGWGVENYGTDPDIEVDILPQDYARGADPQLDRAIAEVLADIEANPPLEPDYSHKPRRTLPG
jgi:tricorn protease